MSIKASVSISEQQDAFARDLVEQGRFASVSAVVQQGLDLLRRQDEAELLEAAALKVLLDDRMNGTFATGKEFTAAVDDMLARKRRTLGLGS